ncbi:hypothetical protein DICPUDRAFT_88429 [Dictyostelium purpureum]|uniref:Uncharacterized protein n=1 Tax=Dictyostelium purpureum TaxID=5786 RepID=F0ZPB4_DICPU|nr:uncharacterized protein DICPUDRAFT_88429 [Dictyostelium purpureum]EGC34204.1 hypothetical protein DICPUDRAFT_88429 [Dictyostelium purpureum]|eukprot:XP_003289256.1 hypothetical protein DICPUDRAFT_88429 [Dictyostelium purpureum]
MLETNSYSNNDVAIVGIGLRLPGNSNRPSELWENLLNGFDGVIETNQRFSDSFHEMNEISNKHAGLVELEEWMNFDPMHFGINPSDAKQLDPQQKLLLKATYEAFEDAGINPISLRSTYTSVYVGASTIDYSSVNTEHFDKIANYNVFNSTLGGMANRISYCFDFHGPSLTVDSACSSSLNACQLGYSSIVNGDCNYSVVCGSNFILSPQISKAFSSIGILGKSGKCNSFDESADGFVRAEGVVVLILKKLSLAISECDQIYAVIRGINSNVDGSLNKDNFIKPSKLAQTNNIIKTFEKSSLTFSDIDFFELHGTGTPIGDPIEVESVSDIFKSVKSKENPLLIGSIKSNIGHLEAASGVASLAKCCLMLKHRQFVKNINFNKPNPNIKFDEWNVKVCKENTPFPNKLVSIAINSFGITGSNVSLLLSEYNDKSIKTKSFKSETKLLIPVSANSKKSLDLIKEELLGNTTLYSNSMSFKDFVYNQIYSKPTELSQRVVFDASEWGDFSITESFSTNSNVSGNIKITDNNQSPIVYVMCGQGPQWNGQATKLYNREATFKESMDKVDSLLSKYYGYSVLSKLRAIKDNDTISINDPTIAQPSIFMLQVSLFELYSKWGIKTSIIVGHSFGEVSAAYCSGMIDLETACFVTYQRSTLQSKTNGSGKMMAIGLNEKQFKDQFSSKYPNIEISCYNSPSSIVISGIESELNEISQTIKEKGLFSVLLGSNSSFHSSKQEIIKNEVLNITKDVKSVKPLIPIFSTVTGELFKDQDSQFNSNYIYDNIRKPVLFQKAIENIFKFIESNNLGNRVQFLELSPNPTLIYYIKEMAPMDSDYFLPDSTSVHQSLNRKTNTDMIDIRATIAQLYCNGCKVNFKYQLSEPTSNDKIQSKKASYVLPHYKWDDDVYFTQGAASVSYRVNGLPLNPLGFKNESSPLISYTSYIDIGEEPFKYLKGHQSKNKTLLAGCVYLDSIMKCFPNQDLSISSLEFKTPFFLVQGMKQILSTNIYQSSKNEYRVVFHFKDDKIDRWVLSAQGRFSITKLNSVPEKVNINSLKEKCSWITLKKPELYEAIKDMVSLNYSGPFQSIEEASFDKTSSLSKIDLSSALKHDELFFNSCILDACFQSLAVIRENKGIVLFEKLQGVQFFSENIPKSVNEREKYKYLYCYSEFVEAIGNSHIAKAICFDQDGSVLINIPFIVFTSTNPVSDGLTLASPTNSIYSIVKQSIDSPLELPSINLLNKFNEIISKPANNIKKAFTTSLYSPIKKKYQDITPAKVTSEATELLISNYFNISEIDGIAKHNIAKSYFEMLKSNVSLIEYGQASPLLAVLNAQDQKTLNTLAKYLIKNPGSVDQASSNLIDSSPEPIIKQNQIIKEIISNSIKPILNQSIVFRILEIGCGIGLLSEIIINQICALIKGNSSSEINIEFTFSDKEINFVQQIKENLHIIIDDKQNFNPSYYDIIILNGVSEIQQDRKSSIDNINKILSGNGYLVIVDTLFKPKTTNKQIEMLEQWISYNCYGSVTTLDEWQKLLVTDLNFKGFIATQSQPYVITTQKPNYIESAEKTISLTGLIASFDQIFIFGPKLDNIDESQEFKSAMDINEEGTDIYRSFTYEDFEKQIAQTPLTEKSVILSCGALNDLNEGNFQETTFDYIKINQHLLKTNSGCKHVLLSRYAQLESINAFASSLIGAFRYFCEFPGLNIYSIDFGADFYEKTLADFRISYNLTNSSKHIQREFIVRDNQVYYERVKQETNLKLKYKSNSYVSNKEDLVARLDAQTLEFKLEAKKSLLDNEIQVKVMAAGINFKDNLVYRGLVQREVTNQKGDYNNPEIGYELSGIVTKVGNKVSKFKVGDQVLGACFCSTSSTVIADQDRFVIKPSNISFTDAASIPLVYITSYYSLFYKGNLDIESGESVLIHSGTGGIGLSLIEILKASGFKSSLFVTVGSKEKEQYLRNTYGNFITGIYSSRDTNFSFEIKKKISEINKTPSILSGNGVDLIINTLPFEFLEANFNTLAQGGRIVDLSINHLNSNDTTDFNKFKYNISYSTVEVMTPASFKKAKPILQTITDMIKEEKLNLIPITEFPVSEIKDAIEYLGKREHIGKVVINYQTIPDLVQFIIEKSNYQFDKNYLLLSPSFQIDNDLFGKTVLITGQRGLSLTILKWIVNNSSKQNDQGVKNIIVFSKSPVRYEFKFAEANSKINNPTIRIFYKQVDISNGQELSNAIDQLYNENPTLDPIETVFHNAFAPVQSEPEEIDLNQLIQSNSAKIIGAYNIQTAMGLKGWLLKKFVLASSIASVLGAHRQCGYVCANTLIDSYSKALRQFGYPIVSINFSAIDQSGFVSRSDSVQALFTSQGLDLISTNIVLGSLDLILQNHDQLNNKIVAKFDHSNISRSFKKHLLSYKLDFYLNSIQSNNSNDNEDLSVREIILSKFSEYLSIDQSKINLDIQMNQYGFTSILAIELKSFIDKTFKPNIVTISQLQQITISQLISTIKNAVEMPNYSTKKRDQPQPVEEPKPIDWIKEATLDPSIILPNQEQIKVYKDSVANGTFDSSTILLTGSTGFLGIYFLSNLIKSDTYKKIYCLTRDKTKESIIQLFKDHQLYKQLTKEQIDKIVVIGGDYSKELFGLSKETYTLLSKEVGVIFNLAYNTSFKSKYSDLYPHLEGVNQCIRFASSIKLKRFVEISTFGVYWGSTLSVLDDYQSPLLVSESMDNIIMNGYFQSKVVCEYRIKEATAKGIPTMIIRLPFLFSNPNTGINKELDIFQILLQTFYIMDCYPLEIQFQSVYTVPVTWAANNLLFLSNCWNQPSPVENLICFNLFGGPIDFGKIVQSLSNDFTWRTLTFVQFIKKLIIFDNFQCKALLSFIQNQDFLKNIIFQSKCSISERLKPLLVSNNSFEGWEVTKEMILTQFEYVFKKKLN